MSGRSYPPRGSLADTMRPKPSEIGVNCNVGGALESPSDQYEGITSGCSLHPDAGFAMEASEQDRCTGEWRVTRYVVESGGHVGNRSWAEDAHLGCAECLRLAEAVRS